MNWLRQLLARRRLYGALSEEIQEHLNEKIEELVASGIPRTEAEYAARREFGNVTLLEEDAREPWRWALIEDFLTDTHYGLRRLRQSPGFTAIAVLTLALGIGGNAAIFSVVDSVLLRPLPYRDPSRLVWVSNDVPTEHASVVMQADYFGWRRLNHAFEDVAAYQPGQTLTLTGINEPEQLQAARVTYNFCDVLGIVPRLGRSFRAEEDRPGVGHVVLLTDALWRRRFSGNAAILGHPMALDGQPYTVVGILPPSFEFLDNSRTDVIVPLGLENYGVAIDKPMRVVRVVARLRAGIGPALRQPILTPSMSNFGRPIRHRSSEC